MAEHTCIFCNIETDKETKHPQLCTECYRLIRKAEKQERLDYLCDG